MCWGIEDGNEDLRRGDSLGAKMEQSQYILIIAHDCSRSEGDSVNVSNHVANVVIRRGHELITSLGSQGWTLGRDVFAVANSRCLSDSSDGEIVSMCQICEKEYTLFRTWVGTSAPTVQTPNSSPKS